MSNEIDAVDQFGNRYKARRVGGGGGDNCLGSLIFIGAVIALIIGGISFGVSSCNNWIQSNNLPINDSLKNFKIANGSSASAYSDNNGLHILNFEIPYSDVTYGDVDIVVSATLTKYSSDNSTISGYGIELIPGTGGTINFSVTSNGTWFFSTVNTIFDALQTTPNDAIRKGVGATNILEVKTHGSNLIFIVNGVHVDEENMSSDYSGTAAIGFYANNFWGDPPATIGANFTNLAITKNA